MDAKISHLAYNNFVKHLHSKARYIAIQPFVQAEM